MGATGHRSRLAGLPGVRAVRRPVTPDAEAGFDLYYVRTGRKSNHPVLIIPGGPGMASIEPYQGLRRRAAMAGLDVIMVEHRGVGLSRRDDSGADLPAPALTIDQVVDDIAAVLDDARVSKAVVYGTSYGSYLAAGLGVRHPARVQAMVLDSPVLGRVDIEIVRRELRALLWHGEDPRTADLASKVRRLVDHGQLTSSDAQIAAAVYGIGGPRLLSGQLDLLLKGKRVLWTALDRIGRRMTNQNTPYRFETDLVGPIGFRELNFGGVPDGQPLDPAVAMREHPAGNTPFEGEPFDLTTALPQFGWPTVVVSGGLDLTTPPAVADRVAELVPRSVLVRLPTAAHSVLDTRERAALRIAAAVHAGQSDTLPARGDALDAMPGRPAMRVTRTAIGVAARLEAVLPARRPIS